MSASPNHDQTGTSSNRGDSEGAEVPVASASGAPQATWDPFLQTWVYRDPATGKEYEWNEVAQTYIARLTEEEIEQQRAYYRTKEPEKRKEEAKTKRSTKEADSNAPKSLIDLATGSRYKRDHGEKEIVEGEDGEKYVKAKVAKAIYFKGVPKDISEEEVVAFFSRAGVIKKDPETRQEAIKLYKDEKGEKKGDGMVTFFRPESVSQAFSLLHEANIRPGFPVFIEEAKFKLEPGQIVKTSRRRGKRKRNRSSDDNASSNNDSLLETQSDDDNISNSDIEEENEGEGREEKKKGSKAVSSHLKSLPSHSSSSSISSVIIPKKKKKKLYNQAEELGWEEKEQKHVILKHMFDPLSAASSDISFYDDLKQEILEESKKLGHVESVKVFERSPLGVVAVKFATSSAAIKCIELMNGRFFDNMKIEAEFYDGYSDYTVAEKEEEAKKRDDDWAQWLGDDS